MTNFPFRPRYCPFKSDDQCGLLFQFCGILFLLQIKLPVKVRNSGSRFYGRGMKNLSLRNSTISFSVLIVDGNLVFLCRSSPLLYPSSGSSAGAHIQGNAVIFSLSVRLLWLLNHSYGQRFLFFLCYAVSLSWTFGINGLLLHKQFFLSLLTYSPKNSSKVLSCRGCSFFPYVLSRTLIYYSH